MRKTVMALAGASVLLLAGATAGVAGEVNCGIVNKDLKMGRTSQDISERMMISEDDIKKCQAQDKQGGGSPHGTVKDGQASDTAGGAAAGSGAAKDAQGH